MKQRQNGIGGTDWVPSDERVFHELEQDFLSYWDWSGQSGPTVFPFVPDQQQIVLLADAHFQARLSQYLDQVRSSNQVTAYLGADQAHPVLPLQRVQGCTQDGLQCLCLYTFNATTKTVYNAKTGQVLSQTANINIVFEVTQSYNRGLQRWQLTDLLFQEFAP
jgi:hypothetical protein